jgi:hypothetical protein
VQENLSRQAAKAQSHKNLFSILRTWRPFDSAQDMLCVLAGVTVLRFLLDPKIANIFD